MDPTTIQAIATSLPNLIVAIWVILNYQQTIKTLLDNQQTLLEKFMALHPPADPPKTT